MRIPLSALWVLGAAGLWACGGKTVEPKPLPAPPSIKSFQADKTRLTQGQSAALSFSAENATTAELIDQLGNKIELSGTAAEGSAQVTPTESSFYVLRVAGEGGRASAFVQVAVDADLQELFLVAVPPVVDAGGSAQLLWSAFHAQKATIRVGSGGELTIDPAQGGGVVDVTPALSETYELVASGANLADQKRLTTSIAVRPVLVSADVAPAAANVDEELTFSWTTLAASEVTISERTFGELHKVTSPDNVEQVNAGSFAWKVPGTTPTGATVQAGFPLEFTLVVKQANPDVTITKVFPSFVGDGPRITTLEAPSAVTETRPFQIAWTTQNASRIQVLANGALIYEPLPRDQAAVARGNVTLPAPQADTTYQVIAYGFAGTTAKETRTVKVVKAPVITELTLPQSVSVEGDPAHATWKTQNATSITLRVKHGLTVFSTSDATQVADGGADVRPGVRTTYVLEAWNDAGDRAVEERVVDVSTPGTFTAEPKPITPGETVTVTWAVDPVNTAQVFGDPTQPHLKNNPASDFVDLNIHVDAQQLAFADNNDAISEVPVPAGFRVPMGGMSASSFWVSTNGFIAFQNVGPLPQNDDLDSATATNLVPMVAPFWDDLVIGPTGKVLYLVEGTSFPRRLIVQWQEVQTAPDPASVLTFQAHLYETGEVRLAYATLTGTDSGAENASVGWRVGTTLNDELGNTGAPVLTAGDELVFFSAGAVSGTYTATPARSSVFTLVTKLASGDYVIYPGRVNVIPQGSVLVNEMMIIPDSSALAGQWVELLNSSGEELDLSGVTLNATATATSFTFPEGFVIAPGEFLVMGQSIDPNMNGAAPVDLEWGSLTIDNTVNDQLALQAGATPVSQLAYDVTKLVAGTSVQPPETAIDSAGAPINCTRAQTFGGNGAIGTPGAENETCFEYSLRKIPVSYRDISGSGTALFTPGSSNQDDQFVNVDITAFPFTYFGTASSVLGVSTNGFVSTTALTNSYLSNATMPSTSPAGLIALFWDDLNNSPAGTGNIYIQHLDAGADPQTPAAHWIVQWHHFTHYSAGDDINFQVKLFDSGVIEYHYADMVSGSTLNYANGNSATLWLARPSGDAALHIGINQPVVVPFTAYRFTPKP